MTDALPASFQKPSGWKERRHALLPKLILQHLTQLGGPERKKLANLVGLLYTMRISADYLPSALVDEGENAVARGLMTKIFGILGSKY